VPKKVGQAYHREQRSPIASSLNLEFAIQARHLKCDNYAIW